MKIKLGLVGLGHLGKIHLKCIQSLQEDFELIGVYDINADVSTEVSAQFGVPAFSDLESLVDACDAIDVVSITSTHHRVASLALKHGKHVFVEKPVTSTVAEGDQLLDLEAQAGSVVQVGHVERFNPAYLAIRDIPIKPLFIESHRLAEFNMRGTDVSVVLDLMIHDLDLILHLVDSKVTQVNASGVCVVSNTPDISNARIEFENGCVANVTASRLSMKNMRKMRVFQPDAYLSLDFLDKETQIIRMFDVDEQDREDNTFILETGKGPKRISIDNPSVPEVNAIVEELKSFARSIRSGEKAIVSLLAGVEAVKLAHEINDQIMQKNWAL